MLNQSIFAGISKALLSILLLSSYSCDDLSIAGNTRDNDRLSERLQSKAKTIWLDQNILILDAFLFRDLMPGQEPNGSKMICSVTIMDLNKEKILSDIELLKLYVVDRSEVWKASIKEKDQNDYEAIGTVRNGPRWDIGIDVQIIVKFRVNGEIYYVRQPNMVSSVS